MTELKPVVSSTVDGYKFVSLPNNGFVVPAVEESKKTYDVAKAVADALGVAVHSFDVVLTLFDTEQKASDFIEDICVSGKLDTEFVTVRFVGSKYGVGILGYKLEV